MLKKSVVKENINESNENYQRTPIPSGKKKIVTSDKAHLSHERDIKSLKESINELVIKNRALNDENELRNELIETLKYKWQLSRVEIDDIRKKLEKSFKYKVLYVKEKELKEKAEKNLQLILKEKENQGQVDPSIKHNDSKLFKRIKFLEEQLSHYDEDMLRYESKIENLEHNLRASEREKSKCEEQLDLSKKESKQEKALLEEKIKANSKVIEQLNQKLSSLNDELNETERCTKEKDEELSSIKSLLQDKEIEIEKLNQNLENNKVLEVDLKKIIQSKEEELSYLNESLNQKEKQISELSKQDNVVNPDIHFVSLHEEVVSLKKQVLDQEEVNKKLEQEKNKWKKIAEDMKQEVTNVQAYIIQNTSTLEVKNGNRMPTPTNKVIVSRVKSIGSSGNSKECNSKLSDLCYKLISENKSLREKINQGVNSPKNNIRNTSPLTSISRKIGSKKISRLCSPGLLKEKN